MFTWCNRRGGGANGSVGCGLLVLLVALGAEPSVQVVSLQVSRPAVEGGYEMPGTRLLLEVTLPGRTVLGLGADSAITQWRDDRGNDLIADGVAREAAARQAVESFAHEMGGTLTERALGGNIDREAAMGLRDPARGSIQVPVVSLGLAGRDAGALRIKGSLEIEVAGAGERIVRSSGVDLDDSWPADIQVDGQIAQCSRDAYLKIDDLEVSEFYCWGPSVAIKRIDVVGQRPSPVPIEGDRTNLQVVGAITGLSLDIVVPEIETITVPIDLEIGLGL
jgi:hypothetical protein